MEEEPDERYAEGDALPGGLRALRTPGRSRCTSPSCARGSRAILFCSDIFTHYEGRGLDFVPSSTTTTRTRPNEPRESLLDVDFDVLCLDHGSPLADDPKGADPRPPRPNGLVSLTCPVPGTGRVVEPEEAERPGAAVRADHRAERREEVERSVRARGVDAAREVVRVPRRGGVSDADVQVGRVLGCLQQEALELCEGLRPTANALERRDLAVLELEDRLDGEELPGEPLRLPESPAAHQVFERLDGEEEAALPFEALDDLHELLLRRPALEPALERVREDDGAARGHTRVDHGDAPVADRLGAQARALERSRELARDED